MDDQISQIKALFFNSRSGMQFENMLVYLNQHYSDLYECIDHSRITGIDGLAFIATMMDDATDFKTEHEGGRGESYRVSQKNLNNRVKGAETLFNLASPGKSIQNLVPDYKILDVLGGDGTLTHSLATLISPSHMPNILTSDLSEDMILAAQEKGLAAIRQPAQYLVLKDCSMDAVILAYGTHHIPVEQRLQVCKEAYRVLKPGGTFVFHDFEEGSPAALWFEEIVDRYSLTGHAYPHFTVQQIRSYLLEAGFEEVTVQYAHDPFTLWDSSPDKLAYKLGEHLLQMYGLTKLSQPASGQTREMQVYQLAEKYFRYDYQAMGISPPFGPPQVQIIQGNNDWCIELPRVALIGTASKSGVLK